METVVCVCVCISIYIYIETEREREREKFLLWVQPDTFLLLFGEYQVTVPFMSQALCLSIRINACNGPRPNNITKKQLSMGRSNAGSLFSQIVPSSVKTSCDMTKPFSELYLIQPNKNLICLDWSWTKWMAAQMLNPMLSQRSQSLRFGASMKTSAWGKLRDSGK